LSLVFYITGHGFGHAARDIEVINAVMARQPDVEVHVRTTAPRWLFDLTVRGRVEFHSVEIDVGVAQRDSLTPDIPATMSRAQAFYGDASRLVDSEAEALRRMNARLVVSDIGPLAFAAADRAGVPAFGLGNFTWDWIYEGYGDRLGDASWLPGRLRAWYALASGAWRLPMHGGFASFRSLVDVPLVARRSRHDREAVRARLGLEGTRPVVLESFGGFDLAGCRSTQSPSAGGSRS
jgi:L-arabinokinase